MAFELRDDLGGKGNLLSVGTDAKSSDWSFDDIARQIAENNDEAYSPDFDIDSMSSSSSAISDANVYGNVEGKNVLEKLQWLIQNDPENARSWTEALLGYEASLQNTNDARAYEQYMSNTRVQRARRDLEAAGINPILAAQYLSGTSGSVGTAGYPDTNVSSTAEDRAASKRTNATNSAKVGISLIAAIVSIIALLA